MADATQDTQPTPSTTGSDSLASSFNDIATSDLVDPKENDKRIRRALKEAKRLLAEHRAKSAPIDFTGDDDTEDSADMVGFNSFGMGPRVNNDAVTPDEQRQIDLATEQFKQSVKRVDNQILALYIQAVQNGSYDEAEAILQGAKASAQANTLKFALLTIGAILLPLYAKQRISKLFTQFGLNAVFANTKDNQESMRLQAERGARSHVNTIAKDVKKGLDAAIESEFTNPTVEAAIKDEYPDLGNLDENRFIAEISKDEHIYKFARERVLEGDSRDQVSRKLREAFGEVVERRSTTIAANEANRVFTMSQFDADQQFLAQNKLTPKAYKRLVSNTGTPEAICASLIEETHIKPIPFHDDFIPYGQEYVVNDGDKTYKITPKYEKLQSGHIHVNCHCRYELLIQNEDGTFFNTYDGKTLNEVGFDEAKHPRAVDGKFGRKEVSKRFTFDLSKTSTMRDFNAQLGDEWLNGSFGDYSKQTKAAVKAYQGSYYDDINKHARDRDYGDLVHVNGKDQTYGDVINDINDAGNVDLATNTTLYRGVGHNYHETMKPGDVINARAFTSTSVDRTKARAFQSPGGSMLILNAKKGQSVILPDVVNYEENYGNTMGEAEVLFPTNSAMTITRIEGNVVYADIE